MNLPTSGPATIHRRRGCQSGLDTVPPSPLMAAVLVGLVDGGGREWPVRLLDHEIPSSKLLRYFSVCRRQFHHVSQRS